MWPYPIDPLPGEPLPDKYDLLIYAKNGHRPQLLKHLAEFYPRHIQIHYGQYQREELYVAARQSRACAYLADDDHGPLALQEILLAGCPTVGVRTGAPFVEQGKTGILVDRLPPGAGCVGNDEETAALDTTCASGELIFNIFSALAQFERRLIQERTKAGLAAARARGRMGGRPKTSPNDAKVRLAKTLLADKSLEVDDICETLKISRSTLYRYANL